MLFLDVDRQKHPISPARETKEGETVCVSVCICGGITRACHRAVGEHGSCTHNILFVLHRPKGRHSNLFCIRSLFRVTGFMVHLFSTYLGTQGWQLDCAVAAADSCVDGRLVMIAQSK